MRKSFLQLGSWGKWCDLLTRGFSFNWNGMPTKLRLIKPISPFQLFILLEYNYFFHRLLKTKHYLFSIDKKCDLLQRGFQSNWNERPTKWRLNKPICPVLFFNNIHKITFFCHKIYNWANLTLFSLENKCDLPQDVLDL